MGSKNTLGSKNIQISYQLIKISISIVSENLETQ